MCAVDASMLCAKDESQPAMGSPNTHRHLPPSIPPAAPDPSSSSVYLPGLCHLTHPLLQLRSALVAWTCLKPAIFFAHKLPAAHPETYLFRS